jgi:2-methylcitrate dehydratase PrpD
MKFYHPDITTMTAPAARTLAEFATGLTYDAIPKEAIDRAKTSIIDTVGAMTFGASLPWSRIMIEYVMRTTAPGKGSIVGTEHKARGQLAALANGVLAHAFEMDSLCNPSVGVHPGASLTAPGIPVSQAQGRNGRELLTAFVAGFEVMYRVGDAARHSSEKIGFHAPGLTGVFGGAVMTGLLMKLDADRMTNALGIAGSLCSGLLEFSRSGGGMVKRMHLGRAAEGGALAATLAREGFTGPPTVLEGKYGFLAAFAKEREPERLTKGLGQEWHTLKSMLKRYACHITAHVPVTAALELKAKYGIKGSDVASVAIAANEKVVSHHNILEPQDTMMCQYSVPFCVALALHRDPMDPRNFGEETLNDASIREVCRNTTVTELPGGDRFATRLTVKLKNGQELSVEAHDFEGMPSRPLSREQLRSKFLKATASTKAYKPEMVLERLEGLERMESMTGLFD